ncbi:MAG: histidinol dehydrogenase [Alphaproteobacteria bacterium]
MRLNRLHWDKADAKERAAALARPAATTDAMADAAAIVGDVRRRGSVAVHEYSRRLDGYDAADFRVPEAALEAAGAALPAADRDAILAAAGAVRRFHAPQGYQPYESEPWAGGRAERRVMPVGVAGLYVPAGTAPLISTLVMLAVPALLAGVPRIIVLSPPCGSYDSGGIHPTVLATAALLGLDEVYAVGGAHGIAALAYGAAGLPRADRIFGPGNAWVAAAKTLVAQEPGGPAIDLPAGPSEVMVIADDSADAHFIAADLLSQAEHDPLAQVLLVARSADFVGRVDDALDRFLADLPRAAIARASLRHGRAIIVADDAAAVTVANTYGPEHLIIQTTHPRPLADAIDRAGAIFIGPWSPEAAGDYAAGPNHVLPTGGAARAYGGLTVEMFQRTCTVLDLSAAAASAMAPTVERLAALEGLQAHGLAMRLRREKAAP